MKQRLIYIMKILSCLCVLLFAGCTNMPVSQSSQTIKHIDQPLLGYYQKWDIDKASKRIVTLLTSDKISSLQANQLQGLIEDRKTLKKSLDLFVLDLKKHLRANDFNYVKKHTYPSLANSIKLGKIKQFDLSKATLVSGNTVFDDSLVKFVLIVNYVDQSIYLDVTLLADRNQWWLYDVREIR